MGGGNNVFGLGNNSDFTESFNGSHDFEFNFTTEGSWLPEQ